MVNELKNSLLRGCAFNPITQMKIFIIGGIGSGKSRFALELAEKISERIKPKTKLFIATAEPKDDEMIEKIRRHKQERDKLNWVTIETPYEISRYLVEDYDLILIDCITMWITNIFFAHQDEPEKIHHKEEELISKLEKLKNTVIIVSNETGLGIIPADKITRRWMKYLADMNNKIAQISNEVYFMIAGIPVKIK